MIANKVEQLEVAVNDGVVDIFTGIQAFQIGFSNKQHAALINRNPKPEKAK